MNGYFSDSKGRYYVEDMINSTKNKPVMTIPIELFLHNMARLCWRQKNTGFSISPETVLKEWTSIEYNNHVRRIRRANLKYPIIISEEFDIYDGMHRLSRAILEEKTVINCVILNQVERRRICIVPSNG